MAAISPLGSGDAVHSGLAEDGETTVRCRIIHVEDDKEISALVGALLQRNGYDITTIGDADVAIHELCSGGYDVCITDIGLPGKCDGRDVARVAASIGMTVIVMTGNHSVDDDVPCDVVIPKPFGLRDFVLALQAALAAK